MKKVNSIIRTKIHQLTKTSLILLMIVSIISCENEDDNVSNSQLAEDYLNADAVNALRDMGFPIYDGEEPPMLEGTYLAELVLQNTTVPNDGATPGTRFPDWKVRFSNQSGTDVFVEEFEDASSTTGEGYGALIIGETNLGGTSNFTVLVRQSLVDGTGHSYTSIRAISGDAFINPNDGETLRIIDFELATLMLDNNGNPNGNLLPNNTGRLFNDESGDAVRIE